MLHTVVIIILCLSPLLTFVKATSDPLVFRGWKNLGVVEGYEFQGTELVVMRADNSQQCLRLCWLYTNCTMVTFYPHKSRCRLTNDWPYGDFQTSLVSYEEAVTVDMRSAEVDKPRLHGCDNRNCQLDELCVPVLDPDSYKCLPLGYKKCSSDHPTVPNSISTMDGISKIVYGCKDGYVKAGTNDVTTCDQATGQWSSIDVTCTFTDCGTPPPLNGAITLGDDTFYGAKVLYTCYDGYVSPSPSMEITCKANNQWTTFPSPCALVTCPEPTNVDNGTVRVIDRVFVNLPPGVEAQDLAMSYSTTAVHSCDEGFQAHSTEFRTECQTNGTWESTSSFICNPVDCGRPPTIPNTWSYFNTTTFLATTVYECVEGYENVTSASMELTCTVNGTWSGPNVTCNVVDCGTPPDVKNATAVYSITTYLAEAKFICVEPTFMKPDSAQSISCRENGKWFEEPIECISCGKPKDYPHAFFNITSLSVDFYVATFYCEEGFIMAQEASHRCAPTTSTWTGQEPICEMISCGEPPQINNAKSISNGTTYTSVTSYSCDEGFINAENTSTSLTCGPEGWSNNVTEIECVKISCGPPPAVNNSFFVTSDNDSLTSVNSTVEYRCLEGYTLTTDSNTRQCLSEGVWDDTPVRCDQLDCRSDPKNVPNATWQVEITDSNETRAIYTCIEGYTLQDTSRNFVKCIDGRWTNFDSDGNNSNISSPCVSIDCGLPPYVNDSTTSFNDTKYTDKAVYACNNGEYWTSECQSNGSWSLENVSCQSKNLSCGPLLIFSDAKLVSTDSITIDPSSNALSLSIAAETNNEDSLPSPGDTVKYKCVEGFQTLDQKSYFIYQCSEEGHWIPQATALGVDPGNLPISDVSDKTKISSPCILVNCGIPPEAANTSLKVNTTTYGSKATYTCDVGLKMADGSNVTTSVCLPNGSWSLANTSCNDSNHKCGPPPLISDAKLVSTDSITTNPTPNTLSLSQDADNTKDNRLSSAGETVMYECIEGFQTLENKSSFIYQCSKDGQWIQATEFSGNFKIASPCILVNCGNPPETANASLKVNTTTYGSKATYTCDVGLKTADGSNVTTRTCKSDGKWSNENITCKIDDNNGCGPPPRYPNTIVSSWNRTEVLDKSNNTTYILQAVIACQKPFIGLEKILICQENGFQKWSNVNMTCRKPFCSVPPKIENASLVPHSDLHDKLNYTSSFPGVYTPVNLHSSSWDVQCDSLYQYLGNGGSVTCRRINDTSEEKWEGVDPSVCVKSTWIEPIIPFWTKIHWDKAKYFNRVEACLKGVYIGRAGQTPYNGYLSFVRNLDEPDLNAIFRLRVSHNLEEAFTDYHLGNDNRKTITKKRYNATYGQSISICLYAYLDNSTFTGYLDGQYFGQRDVPDLFQSFKGVHVEKNFNLEYIRIQYD